MGRSTEGGLHLLAQEVGHKSSSFFVLFEYWEQCADHLVAFDHLTQPKLVLRVGEEPLLFVEETNRVR